MKKDFRGKYNAASLVVSGIICAGLALVFFMIAAENEKPMSTFFIFFGIAVLILSPFIIFFKQIQEKRLRDREDDSTRLGMKYAAKRERVQEKIRRSCYPQKSIRKTLRFGHVSYGAVFCFIFAGFSLLFFFIADETKMCFYAMVFMLIFLAGACYDISAREYRIIKKRLKKAGIPYEEADEDFTAGAMFKAPSVRICVGRKYTFYICGKKSFVFPNNKMLSAYTVHGHIDNYYNGAYAGRSETYFVRVQFEKAAFDMKCAEFADELIVEELTNSGVRAVAPIKE